MLKLICDTCPLELKMDDLAFGRKIELSIGNKKEVSYTLCEDCFETIKGYIEKMIDKGVASSNDSSEE